MTPLKKLHRSTLWVPLLGTLPYLAIAAVGGAVFFGVATVALFGFWFVLLPLALFHVLNYVAFRYRMQESELFIRSGLLWRNERRIPLERIQDTKIRQGIFHQLFRVAKLEITTSAGEQREAVLEVISVEEAAKLRSAIVEYQSGAAAPAESAATAIEQEQTVLRLSVKDLLIGGLTSQITSTLFTLIGLVIYFKLILTIAGGIARKWEEYVAGWEDKLLPEPDGRWAIVLEPLSWDDTLVGSVLLVLGGLLVASAGLRGSLLPLPPHPGRQRAFQDPRPVHGPVGQPGT